MARYISIFFLMIIISAILVFSFGGIFKGGDVAESAIYTIGTIIIVLISFLISLVYYLIDLIKRKDR